MKSLFNVVCTLQNQPAVTKHILADDILSAINAGLDHAGDDAELLNANELGGRPIDLIVPGATSSSDDVLPKIVYQVIFRANSGPDDTTPSAMLVLANGTHISGTTLRANQRAITAAQTETSAVVNSLQLIGKVDIEVS